MKKRQLVSIIILILLTSCNILQYTIEETPTEAKRPPPPAYYMDLIGITFLILLAIGLLAIIFHHTPAATTQQAPPAPTPEPTAEPATPEPTPEQSEPTSQPAQPHPEPPPVPRPQTIAPVLELDHDNRDLTVAEKQNKTEQLLKIITKTLNDLEELAHRLEDTRALHDTLIRTHAHLNNPELVKQSQQQLQEYLESEYPAVQQRTQLLLDRLEKVLSLASIGMKTQHALAYKVQTTRARFERLHKELYAILGHYEQLRKKYKPKPTPTTDMSKQAETVDQLFREMEEFLALAPKLEEDVRRITSDTTIPEAEKTERLQRLAAELEKHKYGADTTLLDRDFERAERMYNGLKSYPLRFNLEQRYENLRREIKEIGWAP
ncbi:hypothetical protein HY489_01865 [Candidatus Woesearchaeota archaeon]|nr:hypothetical protein [Candidatus Woesearchaeota archaeon]